MSSARRAGDPSLPFSTDGVVDAPVESASGPLDPRALADTFDGYELVDHAHVRLSPVLIREAPAGARMGSAEGQPPGSGARS